MTMEKRDVRIEKTLERICKALDTEKIKSFISDFTENYSQIGDSDVYGGKHCGSDAETEGARYIFNTLKDIGIEAEMLPFRTTRFQFNDSSITYAGLTTPIKPYVCLSVGTSEEGVLGEVVDVGKGYRSFYEDNDITGKIALIETKEDFEDGTVAGMFQMFEAEKHGAAAIILFTREYIYDEETIRATYSSFKCGIPVVTVSCKDAMAIKEYSEKDSSNKVTLTVDAEYLPEGGTSYDVIGEIRGRTEERIVYSAHLDHFFRGIQDNVSSVAAILGIAKWLKESEYEPEKTITFLFSGSHEIGRLDSAAPDLLGAWELLDGLKPQWEGKIIADINLEYAGMSLRKLRAFATYEVKDMYVDFLSYMPDKMPGFDEITDELSMDDYYLFTWADSCPFIMKGIPVFMNDAIHEQIYEDTSPYLGRDHSNRDDLSIYSPEAHLGSVIWYGALGIYLDNKPLMEISYKDRIERLRLTDEEKSFFREEGLDYTEFVFQLENFAEIEKIVSQKIVEYNRKSEIEIDRTVRISKLLSKMQKILAEGTDGLSTTVPSSISIPHKVYIEKGMLFKQAASICEKEGYDAAYKKVLRKIDMAGIEDRYSPELSERIKECILGKNATWNENKCKNFFTASDMSEKKWKKSYDINIQTIKSALSEETNCFEKAADVLKETLFELTDSAGLPEMMEWIEWFTQFPSRKTGSKEARISAEYIKKTFEDMGLTETAVETAPSVSWICDDYHLRACGRDIECFPANGTNRRGYTGRFICDEQDKEIVYLADGNKGDFAKIDVCGKIVLCDIWFQTSHPKDLLNWCEGAEMYDPEGKTDKPLRKYDIYTQNNWPYNYQYAMEAGAAGFIGILHDFMDCHYYHEDYSDIVSIDGYMELPAVWISKADGESLKKCLLSDRIKGDLYIDTEYREVEARCVKGVIEGRSDDIIVIHSHHDAVNRGAVQDASGMSVVLALADYFSRLPKGIFKKTLMFAGMDSHYTDYEGHVNFIKNRKKAGKNLIMDFAIEHVAREMELGEDNGIILNDEPETRMVYVDKQKPGLIDFVKETLEKFELDKTVIMPAGTSGGDFTRDDVCSDAYDFNAEGIPVVSILSAPMYLFHDSDNIEMVHKPSLVKLLRAYAYMISHFAL